MNLLLNVWQKVLIISLDGKSGKNTVHNYFLNHSYCLNLTCKFVIANQHRQIML